MQSEIASCWADCFPLQTWLHFREDFEQKLFRRGFSMPWKCLNCSARTTLYIARTNQRVAFCKADWIPSETWLHFRKDFEQKNFSDEHFQCHENALAAVQGPPSTLQEPIIELLLAEQIASLWKLGCILEKILSKNFSDEHFQCHENALAAVQGPPSTLEEPISELLFAKQIGSLRKLGCILEKISSKKTFQTSIFNAMRMP